MEAKAIDGWEMWGDGFRLWECQSMLVSSFEVKKEAGTGKKEEGTRRDDSFLR